MALDYIEVAGVVALFLVIGTIVYLAMHSKTVLGCALAKFIGLLRPNILVLSTFVFVIIVLLISALFNLIGGGGDGGNDEFLKGALIGLIGTGITALTALGNNILEKDSGESNKPKQAEK